MAKFHPVAGWDYHTHRWAITGIINTGTKLDQGYYVPRTLTIVKVVLHLETNGGTSGNTIVDVNKNGTTIFTTQANRPSIAFNEGNNITKEAIPDVTSLSAPDIFTMDVDAVPVAGVVTGMFVELICRGRGGG